MAAQALVDQIAQAFVAVTRPLSGLDIAPHDCEECRDLADDFLPHAWQNIPDDVFLKHVWDLPLLGDDAKQHYLAAWLTRAALAAGRWSDAGDTVAAALDGDHRWSPSTAYTDLQWLAMDAVLVSLAVDPDAMAQDDIERIRAMLPKTADQTNGTPRPCQPSGGKRWKRDGHSQNFKGYWKDFSAKSDQSRTGDTCALACAVKPPLPISCYFFNS